MQAPETTPATRARQLGRANLTTQDVLASLVALVLSDDVTARRARAEIAKVPERPRRRRSNRTN